MVKEAEIYTITRLENNQLSSQIERLVRQGWVERTNRYSIEKNKLLNKIKNYSIRERFFNIWYIMRRASRRQRGDLKSLTCFLETFYTPAHLDQEKKRVIALIKESLDGDKITYGLALSKAFHYNDKENNMEEEIYREVLLKTEGDLRKISRYIDPDSIPNHIMVTFMGNTTTQWIDYIDELENKEDYSRLQDFLLALIELDKFANDYYILNKLGSNYLQLGIFDKAEKVLIKAMALDPDNSWPYITLGEVYEKQELFDKALNVYQQASNVEDTPYAYYRLGRFYSDQGNHHQAEKIWLDAFAKHPDYQFIAWMLGVHFMAKNNYNQAIMYFEKATALDPADPSAWEYLARCQWAVNDKGAKESFMTAISLQPDSGNYWYRYAKYLRSQNDFVEAENAYLTAIEKEETNTAFIVGYSAFLFVSLESIEKVKNIWKPPSKSIQQKTL